MVEQDPAHDRADREAGSAEDGPQRDRLGPFALIEQHGEDRERRRKEHRCADAHERAQPDELRRRRREGSGERAASEHREAREEHRLAAVTIREPAAEQQQARDHNRVRVDDPLQIVNVGLQINREERQRHIGHRHVDRAHQGGETQHAQRESVPRVATGLGIITLDAAVAVQQVRVADVIHG